MNSPFSADSKKFLNVTINPTSSSPTGAKIVYSNASCGQVPSPSTIVDRRPGTTFHNFGFVVDASNELKTEPNSAPIVSESREPNFYPDLDHHRRSSAETVAEHSRRQYLPSAAPRGYFSSASLTPPTTGPPSTSLSPIPTRTVVSNASPQNLGTNHLPTSGTRHVTFLHFIPSMPHGAHHDPVPPSEKDNVYVGGRSYTSVNLQLRQPSADPQPPINIRSNGSSLSYSTSSLDHKQGSRSSLQISIGPTGGSISAMRTNLKTDKHANTAFHIQYSSSDHKEARPPSPGAGGRESQPTTPQSGRRPHSWFWDKAESGEAAPGPRPLRRTSLPETTGPPPFQHLHYPPSSLPLEEDTSCPSLPQHSPMVAFDWALDPLFLEGRGKALVWLCRESELTFLHSS